VYEAFLGEADRAFYYGHSYTANPLGCAVALASLDVFEEEKTLECLQPKIALMAELLEELKANSSKVRAVRQCGFVAGIEVDGGGAQVCLAAREQGLLTRPIRDTIVLMPPLCISGDELRLAVRAIALAAG
jgi:adenosylmethionine-8-amino-7-oxononanoate aminotransferase